MQGRQATGVRREAGKCYEPRTANPVFAAYGVEKNTEYSAEVRSTLIFVDSTSTRYLRCIAPK